LRQNKECALQNIRMRYIIKTSMVEEKKKREKRKREKGNFGETKRTKGKSGGKYIKRY